MSENFVEMENDAAAVKKAKEERRTAIIKNDKRCKNKIIARLQDGQLEVVKSATTSYHLWKVLRDRFDAKSATARENLAKELHSRRYNPRNTTFHDFCLRFDRLIRQLKQAGDKTNEQDLIRFLLSMPDEYEPVVSPLQLIVGDDDFFCPCRMNMSRWSPHSSS